MHTTTASCGSPWGGEIIWSSDTVILVRSHFRRRPCVFFVLQLDVALPWDFNLQGFSDLVVSGGQLRSRRNLSWLS